MKKSIHTLAFILLSFYSVDTLAQIGGLDPTFGTGGKVTTAIDSDSYISAMALQADGKIVVLGNHALNFYGWSSLGVMNTSTGYVYNNVVLLARYDINGILDSTFGNAGIVRNVLNAQVYARGLNIQPDGKIIVGGGHLNDSIVSIWRYLPNGNADSSFGASGVVNTALLPGKGRLTGFAFALQPDGKILATKNFSTMRFKANGNVDSTFGTNGRVIINIPNQQQSLSIEVLASGKILIGGNGWTGSYGGYFIATRLLANGQTDNTFGVSGVSNALQTGDMGIIATHTYPNGNILMESNTAGTLVKTDSTGILYNSFGNSGVVQTWWAQSNLWGLGSVINAMAIRPGGDIVLAGEETDATIMDQFSLNLIDSMGHFSDSVHTNFYNGFEAGATAVAIQADGKIIAAGYTNSGSYAHFALARYGAPLPSTAGADQSICQFSYATMAATGSGTWSALAANPAITNFSNPASATSSVNGFAIAGTYTYIWTSAGSTDTMQIIVRDRPDAGPDQHVCPGDTATLAAGSATGVWSAVAGNPTSTHIISSTSSTTMVTGFTHSLSTYTFLWSDSGCWDTMLVVVGSKPLLRNTVSNVSCYSSHNGSICVNVTGGGIHSYQWSNSDTTACISNLSPGSFSVTVTDLTSGCSASLDTAVVQPAVIILSNSMSATSCHSSVDGSVTVAVVGGTQPYSYSWSPAVGQTGHITGLAAGSYCVTVTDHNGCIDTTCIAVTQPTALSITADSIYRDTCGLVHRGRIVVSGHGGTVGYHYLWTNGDSTKVISSLASGVYCVIISDFNGCWTDSCFAVLRDSCSVLGIAETETEQFRIQPNPAHDKVQVIAVQIILDLSVVNIIGQRIPCEISLMENHAEMNISDLAAGCYFIILETSKGTAVRKLLVEH